MPIHPSKPKPGLPGALPSKETAQNQNLQSGMSASSSGNGLLEQYIAETARIRAAFDAHGDGRAVVRQRAALVDTLARQLWQTWIPVPAGIALVACGGFGRSVLFPSSDVDLLFLCSNSQIEEEAKAGIRSFCQEMWDLRLRVSPTTRTLPECDRLHQDNTEFTISLLDCRFLAGDQALFTRLHDEVLPGLVLRERQPLVQGLAEVTLAGIASTATPSFIWSLT